MFANLRRRGVSKDNYFFFGTLLKIAFLELCEIAWLRRAVYLGCFFWNRESDLADHIDGKDLCLEEKASPRSRTPQDGCSGEGEQGPMIPDVGAPSRHGMNRGVS